MVRISHTKKTRIIMLHLYQLRNNDFIRLCRKMTLDAPSGEYLTERRVIEEALNREAPRYYVTFDYAYRMLRQWRKGVVVGGDTIRQKQWAELAAKVDALIAENSALTDSTALGRVLAFDTASRFFISPGYALRLIQRIRQENRRCRHPHGRVRHKLHRKPSKHENVCQ